ncbi:S8 family serine peptidase [Cohnella abietis]|uniref:Peptidase S8/S53 domain-containing protein n=1 Tax=Cohnella abietis TaxID=2507935 RepID=A0A3T1DDN9_9BACL|nr:S8 family serine peptidase [Cohnella abietis]BBI36209.1 hypothetical protein KCTCHS21_56080 [Cohnella abietis]
MVKISYTKALSTVLCAATVLLASLGTPATELIKPNVPITSEVRLALYTQAIEPAPTSLSALIGPPAPEFLKEIGIPEAWAMINSDVLSTIAIIDTGVDYTNPELKPYLLEGKNLINGNKSAQDDNGHGTAVAGVIAAVAKAGEASPSQGRWKGKILPIKALDQFGLGDEDKLTKGIRYAVDQDADIIVLSLGLRRDAPSLRDAVAYAENKGVLLIAASGNDAAVFGNRAAVQYPAAYPTVLAVAGSEGTKPTPQSTSGSENDVSASWRIQTIAIGGRIIEMEGTSMGAPQVAATAALVKAIHTEWSPVEVREVIRRTALNKGVKSWNINIGYGFLSANKAVQADSTIDWRGPNDSRGKASTFPLGKEIIGDWGTPSGKYWYVVEAPYDGVFSISGNPSRLSLYSADKIIEPKSGPIITKGVIKQWEVKKGRYWLLAQPPEEGIGDTGSYRLVSQFVMSPDSKEPNDSAASAFTLPPRSQQWTGNFHKRGDVDWVSVTLPKPGILKLKVSTDTTRIDPELWVQAAGGTATIIDEHGDGGTEQWVLKQAKAGKYYFRISNAVSANPEPVIGTYTVNMEYITEKEDLFEPNDSPLTATPLLPDKAYNALINTDKDQDWYRIVLTKKQIVRLSIDPIPKDMAINVELRNKKLQTLDKWNNKEGQKTLLGEKVLLPGTYYVKVTGAPYDRNHFYGLKVKLLEV